MWRVACTTVAGAGLLALTCVEEAPGSRPARLRVMPPAWAAVLPAPPPPPSGTQLALLKPEFASHFGAQASPSIVEGGCLWAGAALCYANTLAHRPPTQPLQWGDRILPNPAAGRVQVAWSPECLSGPHALPPEARRAVEQAAQLAAAAAATGGRQAGSWLPAAPQHAGWHIEVVPSAHFYCGTTGRCVLVSTTAIAACWRHGIGACAGAERQPDASGRQQVQAQALAALTFLLAHEFAHGLARHAVSGCAPCSARRGGGTGRAAPAACRLMPASHLAPALLCRALACRRRSSWPIGPACWVWAAGTRWPPGASAC